MTIWIHVFELSDLKFVGETDRAEANFKAVHNSANGSKKEYLFGALVGLVRLAKILTHYGYKILLKV